MTRLAAPFLVALLASLSAPSVAFSQTGAVCTGPEIVTSHYAEQICNRGPSGGYVVCRWVDRVQDVRVPGACVTSIERTEALPARRAMSHRRVTRY